MSLFYAQSVAGLRIRIALIKTDGTSASGASGLSTIVRTPAGTTVVGTTDYTEATITEIASTSVYECYFPSAAGTKVFTSVDQDNSYTVLLDSTDANIDFSSTDIRVVSVMPWDVALNSTGAKEATLDTAQTDLTTLVDSNLALSRSSGTLVTNGTEQTLYENAAPSDNWIAETVAINVSAMVADTRIAVKVYMKIKSDLDLQV